MSIRMILFDLDGTLLPMDQSKFAKDYFARIARRMVPYGYDPTDMVKTIFSSCHAIATADGSRTNEEVFWAFMVDHFGKGILDRLPDFDRFYEEEFCEVRATCGFDPAASEVVHSLKDMGYRVAMATNPLFPRTATYQRIGWTGISPEEFELFTTFEDFHFCKPNPKYYMEVMDRLGVSPEECLMVGNDVDEDMIAETLGAKVFLINRTVLCKSGKDYSHYPQGSLNDLLEYVKTL